MIYSKYCIDETKGFEIQTDGSLKPRKLSRWVLSIEECEKILEERRMYMKNYINKEFLKVEHIEEGKKELVLKTSGKEEEGKFGKQVVFEVRYNSKNYVWSLNSTTVENLIKAYGSESEDWIGKTVKLKIVTTKTGKETIIGHGVIAEEEDISSS